MNREKLVVILVILVVLLACAWVGSWDRPTIVWASDVRAQR